MKKGIIGKKLGMTQVFNEENMAIPVTVIAAGPCLVTHIKTIDIDGYNAIQVGYEDKNEKKMTKPKKGLFDKVKLKHKKYIREFRLDTIENYKVGDEIKADIFEKGELVDVQGISKGKGFQGVIKRHGQSRGPMSHGSKFHRTPGSIGAMSDPARVFKGTKLPGHMGRDTVTIQNLEVVSTDTDKNVILVKGSIPGAKGSLVRIQNAVKAIV